MKYKEKLKKNKKSNLFESSFIDAVLPKEFFDTLVNIFYKAVYKAFGEDSSDEL